MAELFTLKSFTFSLEKCYEYDPKHIKVTDDLAIEVVKLEGAEGSSMVQATFVYVFRTRERVLGSNIYSPWYLTKHIDEIYRFHCQQFREWALKNAPEFIGLLR
jgi:hypothetical protein